MVEIREKFGVPEGEGVVEGGKEKLFPERIKEIIEEERKKIQDVIARMTKIALDENRPAIFRQIEFLHEQGQLDALTQKIADLDLVMRRFENITDSNLENEDRKRREKIRNEYREKYRNEETKWRKDLRSIYEKYILSEINKLEEFSRARLWGDLGQYSEEEIKLYRIEETARSYLCLEDNIEKEINAGKWNEKEIAALRQELVNMKVAICKEYADIRKREKQAKKEEKKE